MDTGPHTLDLLFQFFDTLSLQEAFMDNWDENTVEANCLLKMESNNNIGVELMISRNRNLSNRAIFEFEDAICTLGIRDNTIFIKHTNGISYQAFPSTEHMNIAPDYETLFDIFYEKFVLAGNNHGVSPTESIKSLEVIEKAYSTAHKIRTGF